MAGTVPVFLLMTVLANPGLLHPLPSRPLSQAEKAGREQRILQVQQLIGRGDLDGARQLLDRSLKEYPAESGLDNLLGIVEAQRGNYAAAEAAFKRALARSPQFTAAGLNLGRLYLENAATHPEALPKAQETYRRILQYQPQHLEARYQRGVTAHLLGDYRASLADFAQLPVDHQEQAQVLAFVCADYAALGERERAEEVAGRLLRSAGFTEADLLPILPAFEKHQSAALAVRLLEGLAERRLLSAVGQRQLGLNHERLGHLPAARAALEQSAAGERPSVELLIDLARVAHQQRDYEGALGYLGHARDLAPQTGMVHFFFGMVCVDLNLVAEAHASIGQAVGLEPDNPLFNLTMGLISMSRPDPAEAIPYLKKYRSLKPQDARGRLSLGAAYFRLKEYAEARPELRAALADRQTAAAAHYYLGSIARAERRLEEAARELEQALAIAPDYVDALAELGMCQLLRKDYAQAEKLLERALRLAPGHYAANFNLLTFYSRVKDPREATQLQKFEEVKKRREERLQEALRGVEVRPYYVP